MVNTRKTSKIVAKSSPEPKKVTKKLSKTLAAKPQIAKTEKSKVGTEEKASPLDVGTTTLSSVKVTNEGAVPANPKTRAVEKKGPELGAKQKIVPTLTAKGSSKQSGASSTSTSLVPPPAMPQSEVFSNPQALVDFSLSVKDTFIGNKEVETRIEAVNEKSGEASRAVDCMEVVNSVKGREPRLHVSKVAGSNVWKEKILASGYVRPSGFRRKVVDRRRISPRKCLAKINVVSGRIVAMLDLEPELPFEPSNQRKVVSVDKTEGVPVEKQKNSDGEQLVKQADDGCEESDASEKDAELDSIYRDIDEVVQDLQKEEASMSGEADSGVQQEGETVLSQKTQVPRPVSEKDSAVISDGVPSSVRDDEVSEEILPGSPDIEMLDAAQDSIPLSKLKKTEKGKGKRKVVFQNPVAEDWTSQAQDSNAAGGADASKKRKRDAPAPTSAEVPVGILKKGIWFINKDAANKWRSVQKRKIIPEKLMDEARYKGKEVVHLLKETSLNWTLTGCKPFNEQLVREVIANLPQQFGVTGDKDYGIVYVRGTRVEINPELINTLYAMDDPPVDEEESDLDKIANCITAGSYPVWTDPSIPVADLTTFYSMLFFIAVVNWRPTSHRSTVSKEIAQLIYQVRNRLKFNLGKLMFKQIAEHATSCRSLHQIGFPSLIYELTTYKNPHLKTPQDRLSKAPQKFVVDHKLFKGRHVNDLKDPGQRRKDLPESSMRGDATGVKKATAMRAKLLKQLDTYLAVEKEQKKRINSLARALRYPSDDEEDASRTEDGDSEGTASS